VNDASFNTVYVPVIVFSCMIGIFIYELILGRNNRRGPSKNPERCVHSVRNAKARKNERIRIYRISGRNGTVGDNQ
jgi:hypothetical protein